MIELAPTPGFRLSGSKSTATSGWTDGRVVAWIRGFLALGVALRLVRIGLNHPLWRDEAFLVANLVDHDYVGLAQPLDYGQVCPILFLWIEKGIGDAHGVAEWSLRLVPTTTSITSLFVFRHLAGCVLRGDALVLAVAILAVGYTPIRHGGEIKPYATDFLAAMALIALAVEWLVDPAKVRYLWALAALGPLTLGLSNPAIFVVASLGLVLLIPIVQTRSTRAIVPFALFGVGSAATFLVLLRWINAAQSAHVMGWMRIYWANAFPPRSVLAFLGWLARVHTSQMFAYPAGGDAGASALTTGLVAAAIVAYLRRGSRIVLAIWLAPFALGILAAALGYYPYGGSARTMQYVAPAIIILAGLGASVLMARLPRPDWRERAPRLVLGALLVSGFAMMVWDCAVPYKTRDDQATRDFARRVWSEALDGADVVCARTDLKLPLNPLVWEGERSAFYLCYRAIYAPRHPGRVADRLRVVVFGEVPGDAATVGRWIEANRSRYTFRSRREHVLNPGLKLNKALIEDRYVIYEFTLAESPLQIRAHHDPR